ncbi:hypothetical protein PHYBLDRAFT_71442 [Phycomyces blakesleeanus NRRL 1555(-)]|uniref:Uncharacterized protein n=1 Tax=Phycomyces blakesleeanus (strain ATCC 8743b / DSM 1359 / FGSC 10004 / NBRC 33097 / NRRL 1555) TaxID=763407 RepID=A0A163DYZ8_PHYB8|nr:hypothetical protein PHYBLDRAFT_71442 [Phycomyces blakesleeanus NRRL 1555(-)]OAD74290.1 hypothetical protein PHYBLDRAFT_71442 [Phycomyces blakesleeanus NRRL 1555(-)]|eukprot:XP_018292330.1 hypothetical protein PHYBLDRAFT_71442 [Phycomyces blakesleeanus NRRL 1555(-)]
MTLDRITCIIQVKTAMIPREDVPVGRLARRRRPSFRKITPARRIRRIHLFHPGYRKNNEENIKQQDKRHRPLHFKYISLNVLLTFSLTTDENCSIGFSYRERGGVQIYRYPLVNTIFYVSHWL